MKTTETVYHIPVLVNEVLQYLAPKPGGIYIDATFGGGGHTRAILEHEPHCQVIAMDWDTIALEKNGLPLQEEFHDRLTLLWGNFAQIEKKIQSIGFDRVDGILADFGTSQYQLKSRAGFSWNVDTPLDMRMSPAHQKITAADVVNKATEQELYKIFKDLGEENRSRAIARHIVEERKQKPIITTKQLATLVERVIGRRPNQRIHPATKIFQALRIYVNKELDNIISFLKASLRIIKPHGRLVCISFHSLEDRIVKQFFNEQQEGTILTKKVIIPTDQEVEKNPASRSAKLRAFEVQS